jgi:hypothetical protein
MGEQEGGQCPKHSGTRVVLTLYSTILVRIVYSSLLYISKQLEKSEASQDTDILFEGMEMLIIPI